MVRAKPSVVVITAGLSLLAGCSSAATTVSGNTRPHRGASAAVPTTSRPQIAPATGTTPVLAPNGLGVVDFPAVGSGDEADVVAGVSRVFGAPTARVTVDCGPEIGDLPVTEWHDFAVQFNLDDTYAGYIYTPGGTSTIIGLPGSVDQSSVEPRLSTTNGITLGSSVSALEEAYPGISRDLVSATSVQEWGVEEGPRDLLEFLTASSSPSAQVVAIDAGEPSFCSA
jgi:hypothetical protein